MAPGNRAFGLMWSLVLLLVAIAPVRHGRPARVWAEVACAVFCAVALAAPELLAPLQKGWMKLGRAMHRVMSPVTAAVLFYAVFTPAALLLRLFRKDPLRRRFDPAAQSYWIPRKPAASDMRRVF